MGLGDLRKIGSGNIGATNVLRTGNKFAAAATLILDGGKGAVAVLIARHLPRRCRTTRRARCIRRPLFSVWLRFQGQGVATFLGYYWRLHGPLGLPHV